MTQKMVNYVLPENQKRSKIIAQRHNLKHFSPDLFQRSSGLYLDKENLCKGEFKMKKNNYDWIIGVCCSMADGIKFYKYTGTAEEIKEHLVQLVKIDKKNDKNEWSSGSETIAEILDESNGKESCFYGYGSYMSYHIEYMAEKVASLENLTDWIERN